MGFGAAIKPNREEGALYVANPGNIRNEDLEMIKVWKCPECGHTEYIEEDHAR